jgi:hypothetical protein
MLNYRLMRRLLIFGLGLGLIVTGLTPLSACALFAARPTECAQPATRSHCDQRPADDAATQSFTSPDRSCCVVSQAPLPELRFKVVEAAVAVTPVVTAIARTVSGVSPASALHVIVEESSPPSLQSLLCTLLI